MPSKKAKKPKPKSNWRGFRFSDETVRCIDVLAEKLRSTQTYAVETAIREAVERRDQ